MSQEFDVLCTTTSSKNYHSEANGSTSAIPNEDYIPINNIIKFLPGEMSKVSFDLKLSGFNSVYLIWNFQNIKFKSS